MGTDVDERISSQTADAYDSGAGVRLKPWKAAAAKERITHPLRGTSGLGVRGLSNAAAQQWQGHIAAPGPQRGEDSHGSDALTPMCRIQVAMAGGIGRLRNADFGVVMVTHIVAGCLHGARQGQSAHACVLVLVSAIGEVAPRRGSCGPNAWGQ